MAARRSACVMAMEDVVGDMQEPILDAALPICDAHHHLWDRPDSHYLLPEFLADAGGGHDVRSSVFVEWRSHYRGGGPEGFAPVGETEVPHAGALRATPGPRRACRRRLRVAYLPPVH